MPVLTDPQQLLRLTNPNYADGLSEMVDAGDPVEIARLVFDQDGDMPNGAGLSELHVSWGQFLDHDLDLTRDNSGELVFVDGLAGPLNRSAYDPGTGATGPRQQISEITPEIDASSVYGSTQLREDEVRSFDGGRLKTSDDPTSAFGLLPLNDGEVMAGDGDPDNPLFLAGDIRANENTGLTVLHTLFVREHNHWADRLAAENPSWTDQKIFDAARSIVEAELQQITYDEYLPHLIGDAVDAVDPGVSPDGRIANEFSTAAFRFGHSMVSSQIERLAEDGASLGALSVRDQFFNVDAIKQDGIAGILRGQTATVAQELDTRIVDDLNFFLQSPSGVQGFSLAALNILRGRDHGLETYVNVRAALVGDIDPGSLDPADFSVITSDAAVQADLEAVYDTVHEVDLWVGGLAEDAIQGAQLGQTFTAIIADQFARTGAADATFGAMDPALSAEIAAEVATTTLSDIIVRNSEIGALQSDPFHAMNRIMAEDKPGRCVGTKQDDLIIGTVNGTALLGHNGDDELVAADVATIMCGGRGNDTLRGGAADDFLSGQNDDDTLLGGAGRDVGRGGHGNDVLRGQAGNDRLRGNQGNDLLDGGAGDDRLNGDAGSDLFVFATGYGFDKVMDFEAGIDRVDLTGTGLANFAAFEAAAVDFRSAVRLDLGADSLLICRVNLVDLDDGDFIFA